MAVKINPKGSRILIQEDAFRYTGALIIPENAKRRSSTGVVIAIGPEVTNVKIGDHILYGMYSGQSIVMRDKATQKDLPPMRVLTPDEILGEVEGDAEMLETGA